jgi:predicted O-linked N-acetylglucosamine transferase (SPINDLY family)
MNESVLSMLEDAIERHRRGDLAAAERGYRQVLEQFGDNSDAEHMLAMTLHQQGRSGEAVPWLEKAAAHSGGVSLWTNFATVLLALGRASEAEALCLRASATDPSHFGAWLNLGLSLEIQQRLGDAIAAFDRALALAPGAAAARRALARCHILAGTPERGLQLLRPIIAGGDPQADLLRSEAWVACGQFGEARELLQRLVDLPACEIDALLLQAELALRERRSDVAHSLIQKVLARDADNRRATMGVASLQLSRSDVESSLATLADWLTRHPSDRDARSAYLVTCQYSERFDAAALLTEHRRWQPAAIDAVPVSPRLDRAPASRPVRVGWISPRFCHGPVETFFAEVLKHLQTCPDLSNILYMCGSAAPGATEYFRQIAPQWREAAFLSDAQLHHLIRDDDIDVLVDLVGHGPGNRLSVFAARAAPVQVSWLDYFCTTGLDAMDYLITDTRLSPPGSEAHFSERLLRLRRGRLCYTPPPAPPNSLTAAGSRRLVCLNRFGKLNEAVIALWADALKRLPDWSLRLKAAGGDDSGIAGALRSRFVGHGIASPRVEISGLGPYAEAIEAYQDSAIALDPFPFSGCATTFDALWMGLPVVTWPRDTLASRQSADLLGTIGCDDWIVDDGPGYVAKVVELAGAEEFRREWRQVAREKIGPALTDAAAFAGELAQTLIRACGGKIQD